MKYRTFVQKMFENKTWNREFLVEFVREGVEPDPDLEYNRTMGSESATPTRPGTSAQDGVLKPAGTGFFFGPASEKELIGVDTRLVRVNRVALQLSSQDFCIFDGIRTHKEQAQHVANGTSKTMQSKHLDGLATDNVPWIGGKPKWDWDGCFKIALAMDEAATREGVADLITWGGAWDRRLSDFGGDKWQAYSKAVDEYKARHDGPDFIDGPHYQIEGPRQ